MATDNPVPAQALGAPISAQAIRVQWDRFQHSMRKELHDYVINRAFLNGDQWLFWENETDTLRLLPRADTRVRATINRLWPASRNILARGLSRPVQFEVTPGGYDEASIKGALTAEAVLESLSREHKWEELRAELVWNTWLGGTAVLALDWDPEAGTTIDRLPESGRPIGTGEVVETSLSILEVAWEPGTRDAERSNWWIRAQALPPSEVQERYDLDELPAADASASIGFFGRGLVSGANKGSPIPDMTLVLTYYERPNRKRPEGVVATVIGNQVVDGPHDWPFPFDDRLNMVVFRETRLPGRSVGDTVFSAAVPVQVSYNHAWSNLLEHLKLSGNARLMAPDFALDNIDDLSDLPGEVVNFNAAGGNPYYLSPPQLPNWMLDQVRSLAAQIDDILGLHDVSRGVAPANIESGTGLSILVEQDNTPLGQLVRETASGMGRYGSLVLELYAAKVKNSREARIEAGDSIPEVIRWTGKSLAEQTRAHVPVDQIMPRNRAAMVALAQTMKQLGFIENLEQFTSIADLPGQKDLLSAVNRDAERAKRENRLMFLGLTQVPESFDNHDTHIDFHDRERKTPRYEAMTREERKRFDDHVQAHEILKAEAAGRLAAAQQVNPALGAALSGIPGAPQVLAPEGASPGGVIPPAPAGAPPQATEQFI